MCVGYKIGEPAWDEATPYSTTIQLNFEQWPINKLGVQANSQTETNTSSHTLHANHMYMLDMTYVALSYAYIAPLCIY